MKEISPQAIELQYVCGYTHAIAFLCFCHVCDAFHCLFTKTHIFGRKKLADIFGEGEKKLGCFVYGNI